MEYADEQIVRSWVTLGSPEWEGTLDEAPDEKWCNYGKHYAPLDHFTARTDRGGRGRSAYCRACESKRQSEAQRRKRQNTPRTR